MMRPKTRWTPAGHVALAALGAVAMLNVASATETAGTIVVSTVSDPVGDANFNAPAFQDVVLVQMTKTAGGNFELLMEMAGPVPVDPPLPPPGHGQVTWVWNFDLDPTTFPAGYPYLKATGPAEFSVGVSWDGAEFAGAAIDRRPLLAGGEAIITPVAFSIDGTTLQADLPCTLIGAVPASFSWFAGTGAFSGPLGLSEGHHLVDVAVAVFDS
jgi:hypothetical protein